MGYTIRKASRREWDIAVDWAAREGWNPGLHDADSFYASDPDGFLPGFLDDEPIASISVVRYNTEFGFLGFYIVKPDYRGQGYGIQLWNEALKHLPSQNIGLDGVVAQQENYKKSGFHLAYRHIRYAGTGIGSTTVENIPKMLLLKDIAFVQLKAYDDSLFPASRPTVPAVLDKTTR
jgi:GNAT superfamily N-acetyltransferase